MSIENENTTLTLLDVGHILIKEKKYFKTKNFIK